MSKMYITEYAEVGKLSSGGFVMAGREPKVAGQVVSFTGTPGTSSAFNVNTKFVQIHVDGIASIAFGTAPTAVANTDDRLAANETRFYALDLTKGGTLKISAITSS